MMIRIGDVGYIIQLHNKGVVTDNSNNQGFITRIIFTIIMD